MDDLAARGLKVGRGAFGGWDDADARLGQLAWCLARHLRPKRIVETGVARGLTTRVLLAETVVLATTHPDQYHRGEAQSSFRLNQFDFRFDPIYLDQALERLVQGEHVYRCSNRRCKAIFTRATPIPARSNPVCKPCHDDRLTTV